MIRNLLFLIVAFISITVKAQYKNWTKGEIHLKNGTILLGETRLYLTEVSADGVLLNLGVKDYLRYINSELKQKRSKKIAPEEIDKAILNISYRSKGRRLTRKATYIPVIILKKKEKVRLGLAELIIDGTIKLVERPVLNGGRGNVYNGEFLIRKNEQAVLLYTGGLGSFKKRASEYFKDCPSLVSKIQKKIYTRKDLRAILKFYNDNCAK